MGETNQEETIKNQEEDAHDVTYSLLSKSSLKVYEEGDYEREIATPSYLDHSGVSGDVNRVFLQRVGKYLQAIDPIKGRILDYGCGMGKMSVYLAQQGFENIHAFDLSEAGVSFGKSLADANSVSDRISFQKMDAEKLDYPDDFFDLVIGKSVLHHTIKYPDTAAELLRIMKPGATCIFKESIGNNIFMKLARFFTMNVFGDHGDVNITTPWLRRYAEEFTSVDVEAYNFMYMGKRLIWRPGKQGSWRKLTLRILKAIDDMTVHQSKVISERMCGDAIFYITK